jgi:hypothetical protein
VTAKSLLAAGLVVTMAGAWWWVLSGASFQTMPTTAPAVRLPAPQAGPKAPRVALDRLAARSIRPTVRRNPFSQRGASAVATGAAADVGFAPAEPIDLGSARPQWPALSLIGVSERATTNGVERVAVLAGERGVIHVRVGDEVARVYRVEAVRDEAVDLLLVPEGRTLTLQLGR